MPEYRLIPATETLVDKFISSLIMGKVNFRYFQKRPVNIINTHLLTLIAVEESGNPVAYGHLEKEEGTLWLGIAVADDHYNRGLGTMMMKKLIDSAKEKDETAISLSVDKNNIKAQKLYLKMGFFQTAEFLDRLTFQLKLS